MCGVVGDARIMGESVSIYYGRGGLAVRCLPHAAAHEERILSYEVETTKLSGVRISPFALFDMFTEKSAFGGERYHSKVRETSLTGFRCSCGNTPCRGITQLVKNKAEYQSVSAPVELTSYS